MFLAISVIAYLPAVAQNGKTVRGDPPDKIGGMPFPKFVNSQFYFDELAREVLTYEASVGPCEQPEDVTREQLGRPQIAAEFPNLGFPPQWMEVVSVKGCNMSHERAVLVLYINQKLIYLPLIAGQGLSRFDVILQRDIIRSVISLEKALATRQGCGQSDHVGIVTTTKFEIRQTSSK
jgi:hypothetical protein